MSALREASARKRAEMAESGEKRVVLNPIERARKYPNSLRKAINAMCWSCCGAGADGCKHTRETISLCTASDTCPLWSLRPYQNMTSDSDELDDDGDAPEEALLESILSRAEPIKTSSGGDNSKN